MIDLHIHSNFSDGTDTWQAILQKAEGSGLKKISITDHDNCEVYFHISNPQNFFSGEIITGIEMQAYFAGLSIEILGYGFDIYKMRELLQGLYLPFEEINHQELTRFVEKCNAMGVTLGEINYTNQRRYVMHYIHDKIITHPQNRKFIQDEESWLFYHIFFKRHIANPASPFYINESDIIPGADVVMDVIRTAGGKVVLPHVFQYEEHAELVLDGLLKDLDGIECFYPDFTQEQSEKLLQLCETHSLRVTGGSDYHGGTRPGQIGEFPIYVAKGR